MLTSLPFSSSFFPAISSLNDTCSVTAVTYLAHVCNALESSVFRLYILSDMSTHMRLTRHSCLRSLSTGRLDEFEYGVSGDRSDTGYVGIRNLGCICYMNSLIQQLYMMPNLRAGLLAIEDQEPNKQESVIFQVCVRAY